MDALAYVVCVACGVVNRLPVARLAEAAKCGRCGQRMFNAQPAVLTQATFAKHIERNDIPVLVDFWAPWCGPCQSMAPQFVLAAKELEPNVRLAKVDTEAEQALAAQYGIRSIPTLVLFKAGREVARQAGAMAAADIVRWLRAQ